MAGSSEPAFSFRHKKGARCFIGNYSSILQQPLSFISSNTYYAIIVIYSISNISA